MDFISAMGSPLLFDHFSTHQSAFELLRATYRGQPINEVKGAVQREWVSAEGTALPEPELTALAEAVSQGLPVRLTRDNCLSNHVPETFGGL